METDDAFYRRTGMVMVFCAIFLGWSVVFNALVLRAWEGAVVLGGIMTWATGRYVKVLLKPIFEEKE